MATKENNIINYALAALGLYLVFRKQPLLQTTPSSGGSGNNIFTPVKEVVVTPDAPVKEIKTPATPITDLIIAKPVEVIKTPATPITNLIIAKPVREIKTQVEPIETPVEIIKTINTPITDLLLLSKAPIKLVPEKPITAVPTYKYQDPNYNRYDDDIDIPVKEVISIKTQVEPAVEQIYVPPFDKPIYEIPKIDIIFPKYQEPEGELPIYVKPIREIPYIDFIFPKYQEPESELPIFEPYVPPFEEPIYTTDIDIVQPTPETNAPIYSGGTSGSRTAPESNYIQEYTGGGGFGDSNWWDSLFNTQWTDNIADPTSFDTASAYNSDQA